MMNSCRPDSHHRRMHEKKFLFFFEFMFQILTSCLLQVFFAAEKKATVSDNYFSWLKYDRSV